jgi:ribosomal protein S18 acetylase RimI-like enzyme
MTLSILIRRCDWETDAAGLMAFLPAEQVERTETLRHAPASSVGLVATDSLNIVGWAVAHTTRRDDLGWLWDLDAIRSLTGTNACLEYLYVHEEFRRQRVASELTACMEQELRNTGKRAAYLHCAAENAAARNFYERNGWLIEKCVRPEWAQGREFIVYRKKLEDLVNNMRRGSFATCA